MFHESPRALVRARAPDVRQHGRPSGHERRAGRHAGLLRTARWPDFKTLAVAGAGRSDCMAGRFYLHIEPDGDVHPCGLHTGSFIPKKATTRGPRGSTG